MGKSRTFTLQCRQHLFREQVARFGRCEARRPSLGEVRRLSNDGGPNLLPALLELPRPVVSSAAAVRREVGQLVDVFPTLGELAKPLSKAEAKALAERTAARFRTLTTPDEVPGEYVTEGGDEPA